MNDIGHLAIRLRPALLGALAAGIAAGATFFWNAGRLQDARQEYATAQQHRKEMEQKLGLALAEAGAIDERNRRFRQLRESGVVGEERREQWTSALQAITEERQPLNFDYELGAKTVLAGNDETSRSFASRLLLEFEVRHEDDLLQLIARLEREIDALMAWQSCQLTRSGEPAPGLSARCEISLITLLPGTERQ